MNADEGEFLRDMRDFRRRQQDQCEKLIRWYFPADQDSRAIWVAWWLSSMCPGKRTGEPPHLWGLFQIDPLAVGLAENEGWRLCNPIRNVAAAYGLWRRFGWSVFGKDIPEPPPAFAQEGVPF